MDTIDEHDAILKRPLDALRSELASHTAPRGVEKELMQAFAARHRRTRWYHVGRLRWGLAGGVGSACAAVLVLLVASRPGAPGAPGTPLPYQDGEAAFIALDSLERIENEASPQLVEADLPRSALAAAGVPVAPESAGESVHAELIVSGDGEPLAVRLSFN